MHFALVDVKYSSPRLCTRSGGDTVSVSHDQRYVPLSSHGLVQLLCALGTALILSAAAHAQTATPKSQSATPTKPVQSAKPFRAYGGAVGSVTGSFIPEPKNKTIEIGDQTLIAPYPGFGGVGGGGGILLGVGWRALSLDVGVAWSVDQGEGRIDGQTYTISQTTRHIPLTLRAEIPDLKVRPSAFVGVDWVSPSDAELEQPTLLTFVPPITGTYSEDYTALRFGIGLEIMVNPRLRIPFRVTGIYAPMDRDTIDDLVVQDQAVPNGPTTGIRYRSTWNWQAQVSLGIIYDFALF